MKLKLAGILYCILQAIAGILLLINPMSFTSGIFIAFGAILTVSGIVGVIKYFRMPVDAATKDQTLTKGLLTTLAGVFCMFGTGWLIVTFPVIAIFYGIIMLVIGVSKIQLFADALRRKEKWFWHLLSAAITLICACVVIQNPFSTTATLWMFTGIALIVDAIFDMVAIIFAKKPEQAPSESEDAVDGEVVDAEE